MGDRKQPTPPPANAVRPDPPPAPPRKREATDRVASRGESREEFERDRFGTAGPVGGATDQEHQAARLRTIEASDDPANRERIEELRLHLVDDGGISPPIRPAYEKDPGAITHAARLLEWWANDESDDPRIVEIIKQSREVARALKRIDREARR